MIKQAKIYLETCAKYTECEFEKTLFKSKITSIVRCNSGDVCIWLNRTYHMVTNHEFFLSKEKLINEIMKNKTKR